jgi:hypothetical protein
MSFLERWNSVRSAMLRKALAGAVESGASSASEDTVKPTPEQAVQRFENFELVTCEDGKPVELGRGAMGVTYKAFDVDLHCPVALKVINERYLGDETAQLRFLREARTAASVRHPNVASVFHLGRTRQNYLYVREFVQRRSPSTAMISRMTNAQCTVSPLNNLLGCSISLLGGIGPLRCGHVSAKCRLFDL